MTLSQPQTNCLDTLLSSSSSVDSESLEEKDQAILRKMIRFFKMNKYPNKLELQQLSEITNKPVRNLETWFKNRRRALALKGLLPDYKPKNKFSKEEKQILKAYFEGINRPKKFHYQQIMEKLKNGCSLKNVKNWFNHYKKVKGNKTIEKNSSEENKQTTADNSTSIGNQNFPPIYQYVMAKTNQPTYVMVPVFVPQQPRYFIYGGNQYQMIQNPLNSFQYQN